MRQALTRLLCSACRTEACAAGNLMCDEARSASFVTVPDYDAVTVWLREAHHVTVGGNVWWSWSCSCGKQGANTTQGRAHDGRDRHLRAERRRVLASLGSL